MIIGHTKLPIVAFMLCILAALNGCLLKGSGGSRAVLTEELAIERAVQATGVSRDRVRATVSHVILSEQIVPFIKKSATKNAWRVDLSNVEITHIDGPRILTNPLIKSLSVWLSSQTGQVMKVASPDSNERTGITELSSFYSVQDLERAIAMHPPFPPVQDLERTMQDRSEVYTALPNKAPKISLLEALQVQPASILLNARQIIAYYVVYKLPEPKTGERAVWVAYLRGFSMSLSYGGLSWDLAKDLPQVGLWDWHYIKDAETGERYASSGFCQTDLRK